MPSRSQQLLGAGLACAVLLGGGAPTAAAPVVLTPAQERAMGVRLVRAQAVTETPITTLSAAVSPPLGGRRVVAAPFAGTVLSVKVLEGQAVKAGAPLAVLFSQEALSASSSLAQAQAELAVAQAAARRTKMLADEGVVAGARAEEAGARAAQARAVVAEHRRLLSATGATSGGEVVLRAPISGRIAQMSLQPGAGLEAMAPAVVIDQDDRVWLEARLPPALMTQVKVGAPVQVGAARGRVIAVGSSIDPRTRSVVVRAELGSGSGLVPGRNASMTILGRAPQGAVGVPVGSLVRDSDRTFVFVKTKAGYRKTPVRVLGQSTQTAVVGGLAAGSVVAAGVVSQLKAAAGA